MELYEKAGDTFFNGSRNRDRAVEFYRVLIPPSVSLFMSLLHDGHGELCPAGWRVERDGVVLCVLARKYGWGGNLQQGHICNTLLHLLLLHHPSAGSAVPTPPGTAWTHSFLSPGWCCALGQEAKGP